MFWGRYLFGNIVLATPLLKCHCPHLRADTSANSRSLYRGCLTCPFHSLKLAAAVIPLWKNKREIKRLVPPKEIVSGSLELSLKWISMKFYHVGVGLALHKSIWLYLSVNLTDYKIQYFSCLQYSPFLSFSLFSHFFLREVLSCTNLYPRPPLLSFSFSLSLLDPLDCASILLPLSWCCCLVKCTLHNIQGASLLCLSVSLFLISIPFHSNPGTNEAHFSVRRNTFSWHYCCGGGINCLLNSFKF